MVENSVISYIPKIMCRFNSALIKIPSAFMLEVNNLSIKSICKCKETRLSKIIFKRIKLRIFTTWFQDFL